MKNQYIGGLSKKDTPMHTMGSFLGICTMFFSKTLRGVRFPY